MKIIDEILNEKDLKPLFVMEDYYDKNEIIMFDIETTGLSSRNSFIYLIGLNYYKDGKYYITQLFNDDGRSEKEIIDTFLKMIHGYKYLMEFNGDMFDIPFIKGRMDYIRNKTGHNFSDELDNITSIDLYKMIRPYKMILGLPNAKQKTIEKYLGIFREDKYNGGQLIEVYFDYLTTKDETSKSLVLRHNRDDMEGMYFLTSILSYDAIKQGFFHFQNISMEEKNNCLYLNIYLKSKTSLPRTLDASFQGILLSSDKDILTLRIPVFTGSLRYYYPDSREFETNEGYYIYTTDFDRMPVFKEEYKSKTNYIEINDTFLSNKEFIEEYSKKITKLIMSKKR